MADRLVEIASTPVERRYAAPRYTIAAHIEKIVALYEAVGARPNSTVNAHVALTSRATEAI
jgi:hypothetical protein